MSTNPAYYLLSQLANHGVTTARGLPAQIDITPHWSGVGFSLAGHYFVAPPGELTESLEQPVYTALPGVQHYVKGVSNVRGRLLPIIDFAEMFELQHDQPSRDRQVVTIDVDDYYAGLVVDRVLGMQHFPEDSLMAPAADLPDLLSEVVTGQYIDANDRRWWRFSPTNLISYTRFAQVARTG